ncbi:mitochondrial squalene monooxygenase-like protein [Andalucia godoyi]|uniref:Squalene monooxygenase n=1 Tax=Andalucia godoyi TaxID=505711 RepID=A0A8K0AK34_ANDGO|nr:mitochondrial squalene monooxygenase-like protein [Andalucia godoyi]|eukprot:ANDGO_05972.mRNA.1 mitochondrial squalene monooxygenase-like protein
MSIPESRAAVVARHIFPNVSRLSVPAIASEEPTSTSASGSAGSSGSAEMIHSDVVIVGGGVVGATLAYVLGKKGFKVIVVERDLSEPDRLIGELLQPGGVNALTQLGLAETMEGIDACKIQGYSVFMDNQRLQLKYPIVKGKPAIGRAFHHGRFVQNLRSSARGTTGVSLIAGTVTRLVEEGSRITGLLFRDADGKQKRIKSAVTIVCDGSGSVFRSKISDAQPVVRSHFVGILMEGANEHLPFPWHGHVILAKPTPVLAYPISSTECRVLVDINGKLPSISNGDMTAYLLTEIAPQLPTEIKPYFVSAVQKGRIRSMPNKTMSGKPYVVSGAILLGDAFNCRHPLTGGGMTVAFNDVLTFANLIRSRKDLTDLKRLEKIMSAFYSKRKPYASTINILANALYSVFSAQDDPSLPIMRKACFDYFKLGGIAVSGPIGLLSGLKPYPSMLIFHFFSVALYGVARLLFPFPTPARVFMAFRLLRAATLIVKPLIASESLQCWDAPSLTNVCSR